ncbi:MAG: NAD/NADP octopine/nopaline dehydrogenase family protein [Promethearchaeia archaeon]
MNFSVIGAGSGGRAFASYLSSKGHFVSVYNRSYSRIGDIQECKGIKASGELSGFYPIPVATQDLEVALADADIICIVVPASAHSSIAKKIAPFLKHGEIIILNPGRTFGSIEFTQIIQQERGELDILVGETQTLFFTSREMEKNGVKILKIKNSVDFSTFPSNNVHSAYDPLKDIFPQWVPKNDYFEVTLHNIGMLLHPTISLLNSGPIDYGKQFNFYKEGATSRICQILKEIEREINRIYERLGLNCYRFCKWAKDAYGIVANSIYECIQKIKAYDPITSPKQLVTRYFTEDVSTGLVPLSSLGKYFGIQTPTIDSIIHLSSLICGIDFRKEGRTVEKLKIGDLITSRVESTELMPSERVNSEKIFP